MQEVWDGMHKKRNGFRKRNDNGVHFTKDSSIRDTWVTSVLPPSVIFSSDTTTYGICVKVTNFLVHHFLHECSQGSMKRYFDTNNRRFNEQQKIICAGNFLGDT